MFNPGSQSQRPAKRTSRRCEVVVDSVLPRTNPTPVAGLVWLEAVGSEPVRQSEGPPLAGPRPVALPCTLQCARVRSAQEREATRVPAVETARPWLAEGGKSPSAPADLDVDAGAARRLLEGIPRSRANVG